MIYELPEELKRLTYQGQTIEFSSGTGEVIKTERYSRTLVKGGGGGGNILALTNGYVYGQIQSIYIESKSTDIIDVWVKTDDVGEVNCQLFNPNIGVREGHIALFILGKAKSTEPPITIVFMNKTLGDAYTMHAGKVHFILENNPSGLFKNPSKKQEEFDEKIHKHTLKIITFINEHS